MDLPFQAYLLKLLLISVVTIPRALGCFSSIFSFGDSLTDTGNLYISSPNKSLFFFHPPYGENYFHHPTGRCSDGRLVIDFIAEFLGLPLLPPYLETKNNQTVQNLEDGVNFAVIGATALDAEFLEAMGDHNDLTNNSLRIQLDWFKEVLPSLCNTSSDCSKLLTSSLVIMGEIGGNDYNYAFFGGKSIEEVEAYVPLVIEALASTINELIEIGAITLLVPGNFPMGCLPIFLTQYENSDKNQYDPSTGCLNRLNKFAEYHNEQLQIKLSQLRNLHPHVNIIYGDYYNALLQLYQSPDQFAEFLGLPLLPPYLGIKNNQSIQNLEGGVNFAVAGATALDSAFLEAMGVHNDYTNASLRIQLDWFKQVLPSLCNTSSDCNKLFSSSLILVGEIGGNDYNNPFFEGKSIKEIETYVPLVIETIASAINELIEIGAVTLMVPGNFPFGCSPAYLTIYQTSDKNQYDQLGCLNWLNKFSEYHNEQLQIELHRIRRLHPHVNIIYADYYNAMLQLYQSPDQFGFAGETLKACCGGRGPYGYSLLAQCGYSQERVCDNPAQFISWDGLHSTEAAYRWIAEGLLQGNYTNPPISTLCVSEM